VPSPRRDTPALTRSKASGLDRRARRGTHGGPVDKARHVWDDTGHKASRCAGCWEGARWPWEGTRGVRTPRQWRGAGEALVRGWCSVGAFSSSVSVCLGLTAFFSKFLN
jgi:hypothetical protein